MGSLTFRSTLLACLATTGLACSNDTSKTAESDQAVTQEGAMGQLCRVFNSGGKRMNQPVGVLRKDAEVFVPFASSLCVERERAAYEEMRANVDKLAQACQQAVYPDNVNEAQERGQCFDAVRVADRAMAQVMPSCKILGYWSFELPQSIQNSSTLPFTVDNGLLITSAQSEISDLTRFMPASHSVDFSRALGDFMQAKLAEEAQKPEELRTVPRPGFFASSGAIEALSVDQGQAIAAACANAGLDDQHDREVSYIERAKRSLDYVGYKSPVLFTEDKSWYKLQAKVFSELYLHKGAPFREELFNFILGHSPSEAYPDGKPAQFPNYYSIHSAPENTTGCTQIASVTANTQSRGWVLIRVNGEDGRYWHAVKNLALVEEKVWRLEAEIRPIDPAIKSVSIMAFNNDKYSTKLDRGDFNVAFECQKDASERPE